MCPRLDGKGTLLGTPNWEPQEYSRYIIGIYLPRSLYSIVFLLYSWGSLFGVPSRVPLDGPRVGSKSGFSRKVSMLSVAPFLHDLIIPSYPSSGVIGYFQGYKGTLCIHQSRRFLGKLAYRDPCHSRTLELIAFCLSACTLHQLGFC